MPQPAPSSTLDQVPERGLFPPTAWTLVEQAVGPNGPHHDAALNALAQRYWRPIYVYLRRSGRAVAEAEDLTQGFFVHLLEKRLLERVHARQVRFRAFLRSVLEHYLANESRIAHAQKRFSGPTFDVSAAEDWLAACVQDAPEQAFDGVWVVEHLEAALGRLRQELRHGGREWVADSLLARAADGPPSVRDLSRRHGVSENQMSVALHRARRRLREILLTELHDSIGSLDEAAEELHSLLGPAHRPPRHAENGDG